jgi:hypothetical protein
MHGYDLPESRNLGCSVHATATGFPELRRFAGARTCQSAGRTPASTFIDIRGILRTGHLKRKALETL